MTELIDACMNVRDNGIDTVIQLLENGTDPNIKDNGGYTALMSAVLNIRTNSTEETVRLLLEHKAEPNIQDNNGWTALIWAARYSNTDSTEEAVRLLLDYGANQNIQDNYGFTALLFAARSYKYSTEGTVRMLLDYGADPNIKNNRGESAMDYPVVKVYYNYIKRREKRAYDLFMRSSVYINWARRRAETEMREIAKEAGWDFSVQK